MHQVSRLLIVLIAAGGALSTGNPASDPSSGAPPRLAPAIGAAALSVPFIANEGQAAAGVAFYAPIAGGTAFVMESGELVYAFKGGRVVSERLVAARPARVRGDRRAPARINVLKGRDPRHWRRDVASFENVTLGEAYDGIEMRLRAHGRSIEKLFHVQPGASAATIRLAVEPPARVQRSSTGQLEVHSPGGPVRFSAPIAYQEIDGRRAAVPVSYVADGNEYGFSLGSYDRTREVVIDPFVSATYLGGSGDDIPWAIAVDASDQVYVAGETSSTDFPGIGPGPADGQLENVDGFIARLDDWLSTIVAATYLGGSSFDAIQAVTATAAGVYVAGFTYSEDFPGVSVASADSQYVDVEAFAARLDASLSTILGATYLGGHDSESAAAIAVDAGGSVYVGGTTSSQNFPGVTPASADGLFTAPGDSEGFVALLSGDLNTLAAATYLGGSGDDGVGSLAIAAGAEVYAAGSTSSSSFPGVTGASPDHTVGGREVFVVKLSASLGTVLAGTFFGGSAYESSTGMALGSGGAVYITGGTDSTDLPGVTGSSADPTAGNAAQPDAYVARLNASLTTIAATYLGGSGGDWAMGVAVDSAGSVFVAGQTASTDLPGISNASADDGFQLSEAFLSMLNPWLTTVESTYLGGGDDDYALGLAIGTTDDIYVTGGTSSTNFPAVGPASADATPNSIVAAFVARLSSVDDPLGSKLKELKQFVAICRFCPPDPARRLSEKINEAIRYYRAGQERATAAALRQFISLTEDYARAGQLPRAEASQFVHQAQAIVDELAGTR